MAAAVSLVSMHSSQGSSRSTGLNSGKSVQVAIIRKGGDVTLHVNDRNMTIHAPNVLLTEYRHKPWINADKGETVV